MDHARSILIVLSLLSAVLTTRADNRKPQLAKLIQTGLNEMGYFNFKQAYSCFSEVRQQTDKGNETWEQVTYLTAVCAQQVSPSTQALIEDADSLYRQLLEAAPASKYAPRATLNLGRIAELSDFYQDRIDLEAARGYYQEVVDKWPHLPIVHEAVFRIAATYIQTYEEESVRQGVHILENWLQDHPDNEFVSAMWQYLGDTYFMPLQEYRQSLDCYIKADTVGLIEKGREGPIYWRMATMADQKLGDREIAVRYYTKIITDAPTSGKAFEAQQALRLLGAPVPPIKVFELMHLNSEHPESGDRQ